jgi:hypothetical protein
MLNRLKDNMMKILNRKMVSMSVVVLAMAGCAAAPDLPSTYAIDANRPEGLAIVSLTLTGRPLDKVSDFEYRIREVPPRGEAFAVVSHRYASARQHARSLQDGGEDRPLAQGVVVKGSNAVEPLDIQDAGKTTGRLAALRLPAGEYEFHAWQLKVPGANGETEYAPPRDFGYRFSVRPGEATYIGRLNLHLSDRNAQRITIEDRRNDDLAQLRKKYPGLGSSRISFTVGKLQL